MACVIDDLVRPVTLIAAHANKPATQCGRPPVLARAGAQISDYTRVPVQQPQSGRTMQFSRDGICVAGC